MRRYGGALIALGVVGLMLISAQAHGEEVYVNVKSVKLRAGTGLTKADNQAVAYASFKEKLTVLGRKDGYVQVRKAGGEVGYVDEEDVSVSEPESKALAELDMARRGTVVRSGGTLAASGLTDDLKKAAAQNPGKIDAAAVEKMEKCTPSDPEIHAFLDEGKLDHRKGGAK